MRFPARRVAPEEIAALGATWRATGAVRVAHALPEAVVAGALETLKAQEHRPIVNPVPDRGFQLWRFGWRPEVACDHLLCQLGRFLAGEGCQWAATLTGLPLTPARDGVVVSDAHAKGTYVETYDESGNGRAVLVQLGVTPAPWPAGWGGHPERIDPGSGAVVDRFAPGWNTLDLWDVRGPGALRRVPLLERHLSGFTVSTWYHLGT